MWDYVFGPTFGGWLQFLVGAASQPVLLFRRRIVSPSAFVASKVVIIEDPLKTAASTACADHVRPSGLNLWKKRLKLEKSLHFHVGGFLVFRSLKGRCQLVCMLVYELHITPFIQGLSAT